MYKLGITKTVKINNPSPNYTQGKEINNQNEFIYVARWHDQKNYELLIDFWKWKQKFKNDYSELLCVGVGDLAVKLNETLKNFNMTFINKDSNIEKLLNNSSYYINFSKYEGFSNSILEGLSSGLPVFALDFPGGKEELLNDSNSMVTEVRSLDASENDFEEIFNLFIKFKQNKWDREKIKIDTDNKFMIESIVKEFSNIFS